jgi:hypothetical protein
VHPGRIVIHLFQMIRSGREKPSELLSPPLAKTNFAVKPLLSLPPFPNQD